MKTGALEDIPGFRRKMERAAAKEAAARERAFLPLARSICRVPVLPLTLRHILLLHAVSSPLITSGDGSSEQCLQFLWIISPDHVFPTHHLSLREARSARSAWLKSIWPRIRGATLGALNRAIVTYVEDAMFDIATPKRKARAKKSDLPRSYFAASVIDEFASEYGWPKQQLDARGLPIHDAGILDMPFAQLVQMRRSRNLRHNPELTLPNPITSELLGRLVREHLQKEEAKAKRKAKANEGKAGK